MYRVSHIPCRISIYQFTADWESRIMGHPVIYLVLERLAGNPGARALPGLPSWLARPARWPASSALPPHPRPFFNLKQTNASCRNRKMYFFLRPLSLSRQHGAPIGCTANRIDFMYIEIFSGHDWLSYMQGNELQWIWKNALYIFDKKM